MFLGTVSYVLVTRSASTIYVYIHMYNCNHLSVNTPGVNPSMPLSQFKGCFGIVAQAQKGTGRITAKIATMLCLDHPFATIQTL